PEFFQRAVGLPERQVGFSGVEVRRVLIVGGRLLVLQYLLTVIKGRIGIAPRIVGFHQVDNGKSVVILVFRVGFQCFQQGQGIDVIACLQIEFGGAYNGTLRVLVFRLSGQVKVIGQRLLSLFSAYQAFGAVKVHVVGELPLREIRQVIVEGGDAFFTVSFQVHGVGRLITDGILLAGGDVDIRHRLAVSQESFGITLFHVNVPDGL